MYKKKKNPKQTKTNKNNGFHSWTVSKENKPGEEIKWIPEDTEYKNIRIFHELSNFVAQKALGSYLKLK